MKKNWKYIKYILFFIIVLLIIILALNYKNISIETILNFTPVNPLLAAIVILLLYALKSATVFFPLIVLEIATGLLFPMWIALIINLIGIVIVLTIPYFTGRILGIEMIKKIIHKYPKFEKFIELQLDNSLFLCFFLRVISCLPGDIVSMYFGATQTPFIKNLIGGTLGILPGMILATLIGKSIQDPTSPMFWISILLTISLSLISILINHLYHKRFQKNKKQI